MREQLGAPPRPPGAIFTTGDRPGLALFLNAGDPSFEVLRGLVLRLDAEGVECLELAVPFPNSVTDGAVVRRSARRAIDAGADLDATLAFVAAVRPQLARMRLVLMADWHHTARALPVDGFLERVLASGADGLLLHGVPPRVRPTYYAEAHAARMPIVTTCYASSPAATIEDAAANASAYVYLVAHYGRGGEGDGPHATTLAPAIDRLRSLTAAPIAVGFGVRSEADVRAVGEAGADAAIVGSACVACLEQALIEGRDPEPVLARFAGGLRGPSLTCPPALITVGALPPPSGK